MRRLRASRLLLALPLAISLAGTSPASEPAGIGGEPEDVYAPLAAPRLDADVRARLDSGAIVIRDLPPSDGAGIGVLVMGIVDAPPDRLWSIMSDCEQQDEFLPRILYAAVRDRDGDSHTCELVVDLPFPLDDARTATRQHVRRLPDGGRQRRWELLPGDWSYRRDSGSWSVHPYADGRRSLLVQRLDLVPKSAIPTWILRAAQTQHAPATFEAIRAWVGRDRAGARRILE